MQYVVSLPVIVGAAVTQISADTLYVSLGLVVSVVAAAFYIGAKLREIDLNQKNTHHRLKKIEEKLEDLPCNGTGRHCMES